MAGNAQAEIKLASPIKYMRKLLILTLLIASLIPALMADPSRSSAQAGDAWQLISEVNGLRAAYGLPPYQVDNALMSAAQNHSDYQAQIGAWTHTGQGGSRPHDRAVAAGYGGGAQVYVSENVAMGVNLSPAKTVKELWQDGIHLETMISDLYTHIGAGVGTSGDYVYYTIDVGYIAGSAGSAETPQDSSTPVGAGGTALPTQIPVEPINISTPGVDGSIFHVVKYGQFLENIASAYEVQLTDLLAINGLTGDVVIYPGDKLLIKPSQIPGDVQNEQSDPAFEKTEPVTDTPQATMTPLPTAATPTPPSPTVVAMSLSSAVETSPTQMVSTVEVQPREDESGSFDTLLLAVVGLAVSGVAMILIGNALKQRT